MPYLRVDTNVQLNAEAAQEFVAKTSKQVAEWLGKGEKWVLACCQPNLALSHGGTREPAAYVELKSIGLPPDQCAGLSQKLCHHLQESLGVAPDRVYIEFIDLDRERFGWSGSTFG